VGWHKVEGVELVIKSLQVQLLAISLSCNDWSSCSHVLLSALSGIIWYSTKDSDAVWIGKW